MFMQRPARRPVVAILGGGFAGAAAALHLARAGGPATPGAVEPEIVVIEPREALGHGLAYSTDDPEHRINVPASRMSVLWDEPGHFEAWLAAERTPMSPATATLRGDLFPQRRIFGRYVAAQLAPHLASGAVRHLRAAALAVTPLAAGYRVETSDGGALAADVVVLAMTHPAPGLPAPLRALAGSPRLVPDAYAAGALAAVGRAERVLVVGTGLTSADVIASLTARGHGGPILALSRHGLRSRGQDVPRQTSAADFETVPARTALGLLRRVRAAVADDAAAGVSWHATLDSARAQGPAIWEALAPAERARLVRHLRRFWDVHRFRIAPQVEAILERRLRQGRLAFVAARIVSAVEEADGVVVAFRLRAGGAVETRRFDRVIVTTGPDHADVLGGAGPLRALAAAGLLRPDPNGLGLDVADLCRPLGRDGAAAEDLLVVGPLARGAVGELMGAPEVARHAEDVARRIRCRLETVGGASAVA